MSSNMQARARKWLRRELRVFDFLFYEHDDSVEHGQIRNAEYLLEYVMAILKTFELKASDGKAQQIIGEFLGRHHSKLFLHELEAWLRSPHEDMSGWDAVAQYPEADHTMHYTD